MRDLRFKESIQFSPCHSIQPFLLNYCRLDFEKNEDKDENGERILEIKGEREKVLSAEKKIQQLISELPKIVEDEMLIPQRFCGRIIGKGGQTIREIRAVSGIFHLYSRTQNLYHQFESRYK